MCHHDIADLALGKGNDPLEVVHVIWSWVDHDKVLVTNKVGICPWTSHYRGIRGEQSHNAREKRQRLAYPQARVIIKLSGCYRSSGTVAHQADVSGQLAQLTTLSIEQDLLVSSPGLG